MRARVKRVCVDQDFCRAEVPDIYYIKQPVVQFCIGSDLHAAAKVSGVGNAEIYRIERFFVSVVHPYSNGHGFEVDYFLQRRQRKSGTSAHGLQRQPTEGGRSLYALDDFRGKTEGRHIEEKTA